MAENIIKRAAEELWWMGLIQGFLAIFFGITAIFWPGLTLVTLVYLFSAFILGWGLAETIRGLASINRRGSWPLTLLFGIVGLGAGIYLVRHPEMSFATLILIIGLVLIARGLLDVIAAFLDAATRTDRVLSLFLGAAAIIAGILVLLQPVSGGVAFVWILGLWAIVFGSVTIALSMGLRDTLGTISSRTPRVVR